MEDRLAYMSPSNQSPYQILGVARDAKDDAIRAAYRKLARTYHPDVNPGDRAAEERFKEIASAYEVLSDSEKRKAYDEFGDDSLRGGFDPEKARSYNEWKGRRQRGGRPFENEYVDLEDLFGGSFGGYGGFGGREQGVARGEDIHAIAELTLAQVVRGAEVAINIPGKDQPTRVRIPAGAETGATIRLRGRGGPGRGGGPAGDLIIETRVLEHPHVKRSGLDLTMRVPVTLNEAYNGASIEVPTFSGSVRVTIPPGAQNGTRLRLRKKGITRKGKHGDFYVELDLRLPEQRDEALSEALRKSDELYPRSIRAEIQL